MTIYKSLPNEKKEDKEPNEVEIPTEPLTGEKDAPKSIRVTYSPRNRRTYFNLCMIVMAVIVLGAGVIGAVFLYRQLATRVYQIRCRQYYDKVRSDFMVQETGKSNRLQQDAPKNNGIIGVEVDFFEEDVEVSEVDEYERLNVPKFDECDDTVVWHDFHYNYTAIVDHHLEHCFIMTLNRSLIAPPKDMIDLITKFKNKYYLPRASIVRRDYRVVLPPVGDLTKLGPFIMRACFWYQTFMLKKMKHHPERDFKSKRMEREVPAFAKNKYGFSTFKGTVMEMTINFPRK